jgi:hypothetical protein
MRGIIRIQFDTDNGQVMVDAPLSNQVEKDMTVKVIAAAIPIVVNYQPGLIMTPPGARNGKPIIPTVVPPTPPQEPPKPN